MNAPRIGTGRKVLLLTMLGSLFLALASTASAAPRDPIASGTTDLHMKKGMLRKLGNLGVTVQAIGTGATSSGSKVGLAARGGMLDPTDAKGFLDTRGGFKFQLGNRGVPVTQLTVNTAKGIVFAKIAKARMQLGVLTPPTFEREGFGANFKAVKLSLTEKAVRRISNRLGLRGSKRLNPGRVLSNLYSTAQPEMVTVLPQGSATLTGNASTLAKFAAKGVKVPEGITALAPAKSTASSFEFPIAGGPPCPRASQASRRRRRLQPTVTGVAHDRATLGSLRVRWRRRELRWSPTSHLGESAFHSLCAATPSAGMCLVCSSGIACVGCLFGHVSCIAPCQGSAGPNTRSTGRPLTRDGHRCQSAEDSDCC